MVGYVRLQHTLQCVMIIMLAHLLGSEGGQQTLTFMTTQKTWNEAHFICGMNGGHLLKDSTTKTAADVYELGTIEPWLSQAFFSSDCWIGLFFTGIINTGYPLFAWSSDCSNLSTYNNWHPSEPSNQETNQCVFREKTGIHLNWHTSPCSANNRYICQNDDGIPCGEDVIAGTRGSSIEDQAYMNISLNDCQVNCENMTCIAYAYNAFTGTCYLYIHFSLFHFNVTTNLQADLEYTLYIRQCYNITIDANPYTNVSNDDTDVTQNCTTAATTAITTTLPAPATVSTQTAAMTVMFPTTTFVEGTTFEVTVATLNTEVCQCMCTFSNMTISKEQLQEKIANLQSQMALSKSSLSSTRRKLTSAYDGRASSACIGYTAVLFLSAVVVAVVLSDLINFLVGLKPKQNATYVIEV